MAKKIKINNEIKETKLDKKIDKMNKKNDITKIISIVLNIVLVASIIIILIISDDKVYSVKKSMQKKIDNIDTTCAYKTEFACTMNYSDEIEKANMLDENIVFVLQGYGNVYYTYDCVSKLTSGSEYTYWAYNKEAAKAQGYRAGKC